MHVRAAEPTPTLTRTLRLAPTLALTVTVTLTLTLTLTRCDDGYYLPDGAAITTTSGCEACPAGAVCRGTYFPPIAMVGYGKVAICRTSISRVAVAVVVVVV